MTAKTIEIPFLQGINAAGDKSATTEPGKLETVTNMHITPEHADVFSRRPGMAPFGPTISARTTVSEIENRLATVQDSSVTVNDAPSVSFDFHTVSGDNPFYTVNEVSAEVVDVTAGAEVLTFGHCGYGSGATACNFSIQREWGTVPYVVRVQRKINGAWERSIPIYTHSPPNSGSRRAFIFTNSFGGWTIIGGSSTTGTPGIARWQSTSPTGTFGFSDILSGALLWDVVPNGTGWVVLYTHTVTSQLRIAAISSAFAVTNVTVVSASTDAKVAGLVSVGSSTYHVWHGAYIADSDNTLYLHSVILGGASTLYLTSTNAMGVGASMRMMSVGGGSAIMSSSGATEAASYCYVMGTNGTAQVGRVWRATNVIQSNNNFCGAIVPRGRLWTSDKFFGARLFGIRGPIYGTWQLMANDLAAGSRPEVYPLVYHSVNLAATSTLTINTAYPRANSIWVSSDGREAKCVLWSENADHARLSHVGYVPNTGKFESYAGFPLMVSGAPRYYDGTKLVPAGIPQVPVFEVTVGATGTIPVGAYVYGIVWEYTDAKGRKQRSPAAQVTALVTTPNKVTLSILPQSIPLDERLNTTSASKIVGRVYRSDAGGDILREAPRHKAILLSSNTVYTDVIVWEDDGSFDYSSGEPIYTGSSGAGELPDTAFENTVGIKGYSDRVLTLGTLWPEQISYSKTIRQGRAVESNQALAMSLPDKLVGIATQDGNIYGFGSRNIWGLVPSFADDTGLGAGGIDPVPLSAGIGCTSSLSIVETSVGVFFVGVRGVYLVPRGGGPPQYVGAPIEPIFDDFSTVYGSAHDAEYHEVCWILADNLDHRVVVYNYQYQQWFVWRLGDPTLNAWVTTLNGGVTSLSSGFVFGQRGTGVMEGQMYGTPNPFDNLNGGTKFIPVEVQSKDIHVGKIGETSRVLTMAIEASGGTIRVSESHDSGSNWSTERSLAATPANPAIYQFVIQKTRGVRFRIRTTDTDTAPSTMAGVSLRVASQGRAFTRNSSRRG